MHSEKGFSLIDINIAPSKIQYYYADSRVADVVVAYNIA